MSFAGFELQKGIWARLDDQLSVPVHSAWVTQNAAFPYVVIGDIQTVSGETYTTDAQDSTFDIHVFDKNVSSRKTVDDLMTAVNAALHLQEGNITVAGYSVTLCRLESANAFQQSEDNDHYYHGVMRFSIRIVAN